MRVALNVSLDSVEELLIENGDTCRDVRAQEGKIAGKFVVEILILVLVVMMMRQMMILEIWII